MVGLTISKKLLEKLRTAKSCTKNVQTYRLTTALIWFSEGSSILEISKLFEVTFKTVINWIRTFMYKGIDWVTGKHYEGRGRKDKLTKVQRKLLHDMIAEGPEGVRLKV